MRLKFSLFDTVNNTLVTLVTLLMLYPFLNVFVVSISGYGAFVENPMRIWPKDISFEAYREIVKHPVLWSSYLNTIIVTVSGVLIGIVLYILTAYPLSKKHLRGRGLIMVAIVFTMLFNGGLIPNYYLMRELGLINTLAALVVPALLTGFNLILMKTFMEHIPEELEEAARMDGASDPYILFRIIVPLSGPIIATLCLFSAVGYWNNFYNAIVYIRDVTNWPLMLFLREIIEGSKLNTIAGGNAAEAMDINIMPVTLQYATLMIVMIPILCVYPFLQKYFVKGIMLGSVKG
ncbi:putative aldouronate transport system permease protein [Paenibacillus sp. UNCCL117]|uniref:carbohydrate ABC transporter permease n=1 Tax=unclassified Paenibacillus TaxID=185978 RepID=UPI00087FFE3D|nr:MULTISPECIES: carbohydrate ABC transporter permease [unclassified Paenibacillus]SDE55395.1 putative aldouronate transport system permease protein [Paenibacillus sp. cl123]SFW66455.1 putative aldouronate transport system permease protein [Paenibacillus sp. UNCCL117]